VSNPADIRLAENKALQLRRAREAGLDAPDTLWSNDVDEARTFLAACPGGAAVVKSVTSAWWEGEAEGHFVFATPVVATDLPDAMRLATAPVCFQRQISPKRDVRVTVVSETVLAAIREDARTGESEPLDWRLAPQRAWAPYDLPTDVSVACRELVCRFGLRFGAVDLAMDADAHHWFLELNPNGEWGWLQRVGLPIAPALADVLSGAG
jgi:glutathione synthase/RimK-type ligase-like ATP-grasp enzyme